MFGRCACRASRRPPLPAPSPAARRLLSAALPSSTLPTSLSRRLLNAFFSDNLVEEINRFVFIILGIAGAAFVSGGCCTRGGVRAEGRALGLR